MSNGSGVSRGDRNRNARLAWLRTAVPVSNAVVGIDLADVKQKVVVCDHDSKVLARRTFRCKAWDLGAALDWAADHAARHGFTGVSVACEPTGHRWRILGQLASDRAMSFVCVQPTMSAWARKSEDLTFDKTDDKDAVLIARLTAQLRCYLPEPVDETWGRLRHLGTRRAQLLEEHVACVQQLRDLLECVWPAVLAAAAQPFKSTTWVATLTVILRRDGGDLDRTRRLGAARFERFVRAEMVRRGKVRPCLRIVRRVFAALADRTGVLDHRTGAFERAEWVLGDWDTARTQQVDVETRMVDVLDELELTTLVTSIPGLSAVGAAAILAETGDLSRFTSARAVVKHAGLAPRERMSGTFTGKARLTGAGRPGLRTAAWRAVWGCLQTNKVYAARYRHLHHPRDQQAQAHPGPDHHRRRGPAPAARRRRPPPRLGPRPGYRRWHQAPGAARGRLTRARRARRRASPAGPGRAFRGIENHHRYLVGHQGPPRPVVTEPDHTLSSHQAPLPLCRDDDGPRAPAPT